MTSDNRTAAYTTPVTETLEQHVTIREYSGQPVPGEMVRAILNAARRSPTSSNMQAYSFVVVRDPDIRKQLAVIANNQRHIETCEVFIAICADIHRLDVACQMHGKRLARNLENLLVATVDAALVGMSAATAAESFGLGHVMIGAMRNDPQQVAELLGFPDGVYLVYGLCLGWPDEASIPDQKPRLPEDLVIHHERYDDSDITAHLREYDAALAAHYNRQERNLDEAAWTGVMADRFSTPRRPFLRATLERLGFSVD